MTLKLTLAVALLTALGPLEAHACESPTGISVPDGSVATESDMIAAGGQYHQFMIDMQLYQVCLEDDVNQERLNSPDANKAEIKARENAYASLHNAASTAMERTTDTFNDAVAAYEARQD